MIGKRPDCLKCKHYNPFNEEWFACRAYPLGIPDAIIDGEKHDRPKYGQKNRLVYEERKVIKK